MTTAVYAGSLQSKRKADLREIALALRISDAGTKEDVQQRIRKHLDNNQTTLEDNPTFSGLFGKRKKNTPQPTQAFSTTSPAPESVEVISEKKLTSPPSTRLTRRRPLAESTPVPEIREVSLMLKNAAVSPSEEETPSVPPITPKQERSFLFTPRSILRSIPRPTLELADTTFKSLQTGAKENACLYLLTSRSILSNSLHISLVTAFLEILYILYRVIPWNFLESSVFWSVLLHWSIPTLIIPIILGYVISFHPANTTSARVPRVLPLDPLTASISRLAAQYGYPYKFLDATIEGIDVVGLEWRILNAAVGVAFAFAEAIYMAPIAFADTRVPSSARRHTTANGDLSKSNMFPMLLYAPPI
ncbi:hypothetical protein JVU11DRAFT_8910 [Chiua virens]|nr:hypothetical protein JVU11DRAFT_8910 [Chiua virens]